MLILHYCILHAPKWDNDNHAQFIRGISINGKALLGSQSGGKGGVGYSEQKKILLIAHQSLILFAS